MYEPYEVIETEVLSPALPYWGPIPGGLHHGKIIVVKGHVPHGAHRFAINLTNGQNMGMATSTIGLHINPRFDQHHIVRNSCIDGMWGPEESHGHMPLHTGKDFEIMILTEDSQYKIAIDGRHYTDFHHRYPFSQLNTINVEGSAHIARLEFRDQGYPQSSIIQPAVCPPGPPISMVVCPPGPPISTVVCPPGPPMTTVVGPAVDPGFGYQPRVAPTSTLPPMYNPPIPFTYPMYGGLQPGMMIYISGHPSASPYRFAIDFKCGVGGPFAEPDIALHFNTRFDEACVVRNTRMSNAWEKEERHAPCFPFMPGMNFDMIVRIEMTRFMVAVNGQHFVEYRHRVQPLSRVDTLAIEGDVSLASVRFG